MDNNKWVKFSAMAEIFSSIAILLTLFYLALQTNQISKQTEINTAALLSNSRQSALNTELEMIYSNLERPHLFASSTRLTSSSDFSDEELLEILISNVAFFRIRENSWLQFQSGVLDAAIWDGYLGVLIGILNSNPQTRESWELLSGALEPGFVAEINSKISPLR